MGQFTRETYDSNGNVINVETIFYDDAPILKRKAQEALDRSDKTILRCSENNIDVPEEWASYRAALRDIVKNGLGTVPAQPEYPEGT